MKTIKEAWTWLIIIVLSMAIWNGCEDNKRSNLPDIDERHETVDESTDFDGVN